MYSVINIKRNSAGRRNDTRQKRISTQRNETSKKTIKTKKEIKHMKVK